AHRAKELAALGEAEGTERSAAGLAREVERALEVEALGGRRGERSFRRRVDERDAPSLALDPFAADPALEHRVGHPSTATILTISRAASSSVMLEVSTTQSAWEYSGVLSRSKPRSSAIARGRFCIGRPSPCATTRSQWSRGRALSQTVRARARSRS